MPYETGDRAKRIDLENYSDMALRDLVRARIRESPRDPMAPIAVPQADR